MHSQTSQHPHGFSASPTPRPSSRPPLSRLPMHSPGGQHALSRRIDLFATTQTSLTATELASVTSAYQQCARSVAAHVVTPSQENESNSSSKANFSLVEATNHALLVAICGRTQIPLVSQSSQQLLYDVAGHFGRKHPIAASSSSSSSMQHQTTPLLTLQDCVATAEKLKTLHRRWMTAVYHRAGSDKAGGAGRKAMACDDLLEALVAISQPDDDHDDHAISPPSKAAGNPSNSGNNDGPNPSSGSWLHRRVPVSRLRAVFEAYELEAPLEGLQALGECDNMSPHSMDTIGDSDETDNGGSVEAHRILQTLLHQRPDLLTAQQSAEEQILNAFRVLEDTTVPPSAPQAGGGVMSKAQIAALSRPPLGAVRLPPGTSTTAGAREWQATPPSGAGQLSVSSTTLGNLALLNKQHHHNRPSSASSNTSAFLLTDVMDDHNIHHSHQGWRGAPTLNLDHRPSQSINHHAGVDGAPPSRTTSPTNAANNRNMSFGSPTSLTDVSASLMHRTSSSVSPPPALPLRNERTRAQWEQADVFLLSSVDVPASVALHDDGELCGSAGGATRRSSLRHHGLYSSRTPNSFRGGGSPSPRAQSRGQGTQLRHDSPRERAVTSLATAPKTGAGGGGSVSLPKRQDGQAVTLTRTKESTRKASAHSHRPPHGGNLSPLRLLESRPLSVASHHALQHAEFLQYRSTYQKLRVRQFR